jgi:tetratricopeptide (TPR) repeat protein
MLTSRKRAMPEKRASDQERAGRNPAAGQRLVGASVRFMLLVVGLVIVAGYALAPRYNERLAMLADAHGPAELIGLLEQRRTGGDQDPTLLASLSRAYEAAGNYQQAADDLERYGRLRPGGIQILTKLAELYEKAGNEPKRMATLEALVAMAPALPSAAALSEIYFRNGRVDDARTLLSRFLKELTVENGLLLRLAEFDVAAGAKDEAVAVLKRSGSGLRWWRRSNDDRERFLLAELLLQTGRGAETVSLGKRWVEEWPDAWRAGKLLRMVAADARVTDAAVLADAVVAAHPETRLYLAHELFAMGARPLSRRLLVTWAAAQTHPTAADIAAFLTVCREFHDPGIVWQAFGEVLAAHRSPDFVISFSEAVAAEFGIRALAPYWNALPKRLAQRRPLLAARLVFDANDIPLTRYFLGRVDISALDSSGQQIWFDLLNTVAEPKVALEVLRIQRSGGHLSPRLLAQYARLAGAYGHDGELRAALADLQSDK